MTSPREPLVCIQCGAPKPVLGVLCDCGEMTAGNRPTERIVDVFTISAEIGDGVADR